MSAAIVIGGAGVVGTWIRRVLDRNGWNTYSVDLRSSDANMDGKNPDARLAELISTAEMVVLALPESVVVEVAQQVEPLLSADGIIVSTASVQSPLFESEVGRRLKTRLIGCNPMFRPTLGTEGRSVLIVGDEAVREDGIATVAGLLLASGAIVERMTPNDHDTAMSLLQVLPHAALLATASVLGTSGFDPGVLWRIAPPPARVMISAASRMLQSSTHVYADIQRSDDADRVRQRLVASINELSDGSAEDLLKKIEQCRLALGDVVEEGAAVAAVVYANIGAGHTERTVPCLTL